MGTRRKLRPAPWAGSNSRVISASRWSALILVSISQAEVSVMAAPKPSMVW